MAPNTDGGRLKASSRDGQIDQLRAGLVATCPAQVADILQRITALIEHLQSARDVVIKRGAFSDSLSRREVLGEPPPKPPPMMNRKQGRGLKLLIYGAPDRT